MRLRIKKPDNADIKERLRGVSNVIKKAVRECMKDYFKNIFEAIKAFSLMDVLAF